MKVCSSYRKPAIGFAAIDQQRVFVGRTVTLNIFDEFGDPWSYKPWKWSIGLVAIGSRSHVLDHRLVISVDRVICKKLF